MQMCEGRDSELLANQNCAVAYLELPRLWLSVWGLRLTAPSLIVARGYRVVVHGQCAAYPVRVPTGHVGAPTFAPRVIWAGQKPLRYFEYD